MELSRKFKGKKFMWDGIEYPSEEEAKERIEKYSRDGFETQLVKENDKWYVFTRKVVTEIKLDGSK